MVRKLAIASVIVLLLAGTVFVLWAGLNWPPPLWVVEYGLPGSQGPTGRMAKIQGIVFVEVFQGYFRMGSHFGCQRGDVMGRIARPLSMTCGTPAKHRRDSGECPPRWTCIPGPFWIARTETTWEQYDPSSCPAEHKEDPVDCVNWIDAVKFAQRVARKTGVPLRLPTEAEWECACRAGTTTAFSFGDSLSAFQAHCSDLGAGYPARVASRAPNPWGLFDMHANLREWCVDPWDRPLPPAVLNPPGTGQQGKPAYFRVVRGGGIYCSPWMCRSSYRSYEYAGLRSNTIGFRLAFTLTPDQEPLIELYLVKGK